MGKGMRGKRLTRSQKIFVSKSGKPININNWLCAKETDTELVLVNKVSGRKKIILKEG
ncbi:MAG: hypothetical protein Q4G33_11385 [bacterium]|nr:hypothetical protein [bacterium]